MGVPTSDVGYTSATARRGDHESSYEHVVALEKKNHFFVKKFIELMNLLRSVINFYPIHKAAGFSL